ncbi:conserved hypothetical protein [Paraburkholderia atlantica]|uniref:Uncharacterized protein n=1 Tax=Paraburkholderia atlantica TaxID=2654982 RepID=D5WI90_PARAM|nr:hypothetical protein [Paraburkholderia atlantica]ADG18185.1 conserved hypothetical protein [Paraburkholderia atlantica]
MTTNSESDHVPNNFPHHTSPEVVAGAQPKICVVLSEGKYVAGQTDNERRERWRICEDLAHQLMPKAEKDAAAHPEHSKDVTLDRIRAAVARKGWVSHAELKWLISRMRVLLNW